MKHTQVAWQDQLEHDWLTKDREAKMKPSGCWNCNHARSIDLDRRKHTPGKKYKARCVAPENNKFGGIASIVMIEEKPELPVCEWWNGDKK